MQNKSNDFLEVKGSVSPGFESVKDLFEKTMNSKSEDKAQLCVYFQGNKVVDLYASKKEDEKFSPDSLINIWSSGKSLESIAIASLVDKGLLQYEDKISNYWPEFAENGKGDITIADLMRHEAGLFDLNYSFEAEQLQTENIKNNSAGIIIEKAVPNIPDDSRFRRKYHALSRGWIVNEVFRRVDPKGRTLGEYLRADIAGPLDVDILVGAQEQDLINIEKVKVFGVLSHLLESFKPKALGRKVKHSFLNILSRLIQIIFNVLNAAFQNKNKKTNKAKKRIPLKGLNPRKDGYKSFNKITQGAFALSESSSFNTKASARGLAKLAAMLSARGKFEEQEYISNTAWQAMHSEVVTANLGLLGSSYFSQGGVHFFKLKGTKNSVIERAVNKGREGFFGWMGLGGSIFQWHPDLDIGFAFVPTSLHLIDGFNERGKIYQEEVLRCANSIK